MTKLASLLLGLTLVASQVFAQEDYEVKTLTLAHDCAPTKQIIPQLREQYGERPFALGIAVVTLPDGRPLEGVLMLTVNPESRSYTVNIMFVEDEMMCMLTSGDDFQPADIPGLRL